jgi:hypothetical protein
VSPEPHGVAASQRLARTDEARQRLREQESWLTRQIRALQPSLTH